MRGLDYGPAFQRLAELWRQDGEAIARLQSPAKGTSGHSADWLHPTLLDACFQTLGAALPQAADRSSAPAMPVGLGRLQILHAPEGGLWAHARLTTTPGSIEGNILLLDDSGQVVARVSGLRIQTLERPASVRDAFADWLFEIQWQPQDLMPAGPAAEGKPGSWLLFADRHGVGEAMIRSLTASGERCLVINEGSAYRHVPPEAGVTPGLVPIVERYELDPMDVAGYRQLINELAGACRGVIHLWGLDVHSPLARAQVPVCMSVVHLVQAFSTAGWRDLPRLWLVTRGLGPFTGTKCRAPGRQRSGDWATPCHRHRNWPARVDLSASVGRKQ